MTRTQRSALLSFVLAGFLLGVLAGCGTSNPYIGKAEDAIKKKNYEQALANIDTALAQDSTVRGKAYKMRAQVLRQMADSSMSADKYKGLYRQARVAEDSAMNYDPGIRSDVKARRTLAFTQQFQQGAKSFQKAQRTGDSTAFRQAASHFGAAAATYPDSANATLNEAYARLNLERMKQNGSMTNAIPTLEQYLKKADEPRKNAYDILSGLYMQNGQIEKAISLLEDARKDLSERPTYFKLRGSRGLKYSGTVKTGGNSREVEGTVPGKVKIDGKGMVSGKFKKKQKKGQMRIQLSYKGSVVQDTTSRSGVSGPVSLSADLSEKAPLAQLEGRLLNAYNRAGKTKKAMAEYREQIKKHPENSTYRYNYGSMLLRADRYDEAIEQLKEAIKLEPGNAKAQYNLGAAYTNKGKRVQDSLRAIEDSLNSIRDAAMEENREPTEEEKRIVNELDRKSKKLSKKKKKIFENAIPPLERARQLVDSGASIRKQTCVALVTAYIQTEQVKKAKQVEECAGMKLKQGGKKQGGN